MRGPGAVSPVSFDVAPDGERLLMIKDDPSPAGRRGAADIVIVLNWFEELKQRVPTDGSR